MYIKAYTTYISFDGRPQVEAAGTPTWIRLREIAYFRDNGCGWTEVMLFNYGPYFVPESAEILAERLNG
jgi:hypothetical protein